MREDNTKSSLGDWNAIKTLWSYSQSHKKPIILGMFLLFFSSSLGILSALSMGALVEKGLVQKSLKMSYSLGALMLLAELGAVLFLYVGRRILSINALCVLFELRQKLFQKLSSLPTAYFDRTPKGRTITRLSSDIEHLESFFSNTLARLLSSIFSITTVCFAMIFTHPKIGALLILVVLPAITLVMLLKNKVRVYNRDFAKKNSAINSKLSEFLNGISLIRAFGLEKWSENVFNAFVQRHLNAGLRINLLNSWSRPLVIFLCLLPTVFFFVIGSKAVAGGTLGIGLFVTFTRYCERFTRPIFSLSHEIHNVQNAFSYAERVAIFLEEEEDKKVNPTLPKKEHQQIEKPFRNSIEFQKLSMRYDSSSDWILKEIQLSIQYGEKVALVGKTGSGKSTFANLLSRMYPYQKGDILLGDYSLRSWTRQELQKDISFVTQDPVIFEGTVYENLVFDHQHDWKSVRQLCERCGLLAILKKNGRDLESLLSTGGTNLSTGEAQLISLTRSLLNDSSLVVLDEATANIDEEVEKLVQKVLTEEFGDRSVLMIAHRIKTLSLCNRILVFDHGRLIEDGERQILNEQKGHFYQLQKNLEA